MLEAEEALLDKGAVVVNPADTRRNFWAFFILGLINNLGFVVVLSGAKSLADSFGASNLIGVINWADVGLGVFVRSLNAFALESSAFMPRVCVAGGLLLIGLLGLAATAVIPALHHFSVVIASVAFIGASSSFGESVLLGYLKSFGDGPIGGWSSGTGMAGVGGATFYLVLSGPAGLGDAAIFATMIPTAVIYVLVFVFMVDHAHVEGSATGDVQPRGGHRPSIQMPDLPPLPSFEDGEEGDGGGSVASKPPPVVEPAPRSTERICRVTKSVTWLATNLAFVYFFEYVVSVGFAARANGTDTAQEHSKRWVIRHAYAILALCYQFGVLISRSSLAFVQFRRVHILTALQGANFVFWLLQAYFVFTSVWIQFVLMVYVGLLGGAMYVNVFSLLSKDDAILPQDKELAINISALFINAGIVTASVFEIVADATFLKK